MNDWLRRDGLDILTTKVQNDLNGKLKQQLKQAALSENLLRTISLKEIARVNFPKDEGSKNQKKQADRFHKTISMKEQLDELAETGSAEALFAWICEEYENEIKLLIERLSRHDVLGHYLLERLEKGEKEAPGYVCLLREMTSLPKRTAEKVAKGLSKQEYNAIRPKTDAGGLNFSHSDFAMPISEIASPTIEHLLQSFSNLFGRIGVADPFEDDIAAITQLSIQKGGKQ
ncbi:hypothetical protein ACQ5SP_08250 [Rhodovulum sp. YNF3179]|uniref:hypothetical protein n=1 Tax=Rhodovulum sp. YNF3179 TaxID=3425127 RepID=UPI003D355BB0